MKGTPTLLTNIVSPRMHFMDDFGFIVLDIDWTFPRDSGEYVCRATNKWGTASTKATLICKGRAGDRLHRGYSEYRHIVPCPSCCCLSLTCCVLFQLGADLFSVGFLWNIFIWLLCYVFLFIA